MSVWLSDESLFSLNLISNYENRSYFSKEDELKIFETKKSQKTFSIWAAIRGDGSLIYRMIEGIQQSENYINLLIDVFPVMDSKSSFFMQDGASIHKSFDAIDWISFLWKDRWIGLKSTRLEFPPLSPDLTPLDFSFWSLVKRRVAQRSPRTFDDLKVITIQVLDQVEAEVIRRMCQEVDKRCRVCIQCNGGRFEHLLKN